MAEIILEPYAVRQEWRLDGTYPDWQGFLNAYLIALALACQRAGSPLIGHIKALALFPEGGYYRASVVGTKHPPTTEGTLPVGLASLEISLNLIVYGLERQVLARLTAETGARLAEMWRGEVIDRSE